jgi:hypothetical protein
MIHFRLPNEKDGRIAACEGYWCAHNTDDWEQVDCEECLKIRDGVMVLQKFEYGNHEPKETKAFYGHARTEWKANRYQYTRTVRPDPEPSK